MTIGPCTGSATECSPWVLACPLCRSLMSIEESILACSTCGRRFPRDGGIWHCLPDERRSRYDQFLHEYQQFRRWEGWGSDTVAYYRSLPIVLASDPQVDRWRTRARSFHTLVQKVLEPLEAAGNGPLRVLDLGAGNGWLSNRLACRGHLAAAIDLSIDHLDGLAAHRYYERDRWPAGVPALTPIQAEFDRLPLAADQADLVIFNASLHYSASYKRTLREAIRVLRPDGRLVIMESPIYRSPDSGDAMVREREATSTFLHGFPSNALRSENYLTWARLTDLAQQIDVRWEIITPPYGWRWRLRPWSARLLRRREPASFHLVVGHRADDGS